MSLKKYKKVIVKNTKGERKEFLFKPVVPDEENPDVLICDRCPYGIDICSNLPDPTEPESKHRTFQDFCIGIKDDVTEEDYYSSIGYVPQTGTIENNMADMEKFQRVIGKCYVDIKDVIKTLCSDICSRYRDDFKNCTSDYSGCILHDLLQKTKLNGKN